MFPSFSTEQGVPFEEGLGERVHEVARDDAVERPRAVRGLVPLVAEPRARRGVEVERDLALRQPRVHLGQAHGQDPVHVLPAEAVEKHQLVWGGVRQCIAMGGAE